MDERYAGTICGNLWLLRTICSMLWRGISGKYWDCLFCSSSTHRDDSRELVWTTKFRLCCISLNFVFYVVVWAAMFCLWGIFIITFTLALEAIPVIMMSAG